MHIHPWSTSHRVPIFSLVLWREECLGSAMKSISVIPYWFYWLICRCRKGLGYLIILVLRIRISIPFSTLLLNAWKMLCNIFTKIYFSLCLFCSVVKCLQHTSQHSKKLPFLIQTHKCIKSSIERITNDIRTIKETLRELFNFSNISSYSSLS